MRVILRLFRWVWIRMYIGNKDALRPLLLVVFLNGRSPYGARANLEDGVLRLLLTEGWRLAESLAIHGWFLFAICKCLARTHVSTLSVLPEIPREHSPKKQFFVSDRKSDRYGVFINHRR